MIFTTKKPFNEILKYLENDKKIFIVGCAQCSTVCKSGGEEEVATMKKMLEEQGKVVTGTVVMDPPCNLLEVKKRYRENKEAIEQCDSILVLTCGDGVQTVMEGTQRKVRPALDTVFLGEVERAGHFKETCSLCGECVLDSTGGLCPMTLCPKGLLNGPCGGSKDGKCEVDREKDCAWVLIYKRLTEIGELDKIKTIKPPKDYSKAIKPRKLILEDFAKKRI